jgi:hypothetical protein
MFSQLSKEHDKNITCHGLEESYANKKVKKALSFKLSMGVFAEKCLPF